MPEPADFARSSQSIARVSIRGRSDFAPDAVSHQAAQASVSESVKDPVRDASVNVLGSLNLLRAALTARCQVFTFASTGGAIYGNVPEGTRASVATPPNPECPYAVSKLAFEHYLRVHRNHISARILRYANVYGPRQSATGEAGVVAIFMTRLLRGEDLQVNAAQRTGDGGCIRDYVYVGDVARTNLKALEASDWDPILNVCTGIGTSTERLLGLIADQANRKPRVTQNPPRSGDVPRSVLDPEGLELKIGPLFPLCQGLAETLRWYHVSST